MTGGSVVRSIGCGWIGVPHGALGTAAPYPLLVCGWLPHRQRGLAFRGGGLLTEGMQSLRFSVEHIGLAARDTLQARGVVFTEAIKPFGGGGRALFFHDIEGNLLHLVERGAGFLAERVA